MSSSAVVSPLAEMKHGDLESEWASRAVGASAGGLSTVMYAMSASVGLWCWQEESLSMLEGARQCILQRA